MYKFVLEKAPNFDESEELYSSSIADIATTIEEIFKSSVKTINSEIFFESNLTEAEIKDKLRDTFSHHFDHVRYLSLEVIKK